MCGTTRPSPEGLLFHYSDRQSTRTRGQEEGEGEEKSKERKGGDVNGIYKLSLVVGYLIELAQYREAKLKCTVQLLLLLRT